MATSIAVLGVVTFFLLYHQLPKFVAASGDDDTCFPSLFAFGDSLTDTGNAAFVAPPAVHYPSSNPPYGETFFHHPTGRFSDGQIFVDFLAKALGLPLLNPSLKNASDSQYGINFAFAGATAINKSTLLGLQVSQVPVAVSLEDQLNWFKSHKASIVQKEVEGMEDIFGKALYLVGEIGGNDINYAFMSNRSLEEAHNLVPVIVSTVQAFLEGLINEGAKTILVQGQLPFGCTPAYLTSNFNSSIDQYDEFGCLKAFNNFATMIDTEEKKMLKSLREEHPNLTIMHFDYYGAFMDNLQYAKEYGFAQTLVACCGMGGNYNYNAIEGCGDVITLPSGETQTISSCEDPQAHISWDGVHLTQASYKALAHKLFVEGFLESSPSFMVSCLQSENIK